MQPYLQLNSHYIGKSHLDKEKPCEDYSLSYGDNSLSAAVISDGHGDGNCFRSAAGAKFACEICLSLLRQFQGINSHITDIRSCDFEENVRSLEREIVVKWKKKVLSDAASNPFSAEELEQAAAEVREQYRNGRNIEHAYGCTLIAVMVTKHYFLCLQIGDGKCVAAYPGGIFVEPVPTDENCVGNRSTSLCNRDAEKSFRHYFNPILPLAAFVSSDGVEESFDCAGLYNFFYSIAYWCRQEGKECASDKLTALLPKISEGGSGDDVSVAACLSTDGELAAPKQPLEQVYHKVNAIASNVEMLDGMISRENEKSQEKIRFIECAESELDSLKKRIEETENSYYAACDECDQLKAGVSELKKKREVASEQMNKAEAYKNMAERFWFSEYTKLGITGFSKSDTEEISSQPTDRQPEKPSDTPVKTVFAENDNSCDDDTDTVIIVD